MGCRYFGAHGVIATAVGFYAFTSKPATSKWLDNLELVTMQSCINLVVTLRARSGQLDALRDALRTLRVDSLKEAGCITYRLGEAVDEDTLYLLERWESQEALELHEQTEHFVKGVEKVQSLCSSAMVHKVAWED